MDKLTVLSLEQALSLSYATQRFVQLGWRVIRVESTPVKDRLPGDPNRYVGKPAAAEQDPDLRSYFVGPNVGKETIALNLKEPQGRKLLQRLITDLPVDIFAANTLPKRYEQLGIDYPTLSALRTELIWAGLSAMGPDYPNAPGYDPALQAMTGYMDVTGHPDGPPTLCGVPFVDLKAGDEVFAHVCLALAQLAKTGKGARIDISMAQAAASWLVTTIPLLDLGYKPHEIRRSGNEHREFVPVNVYPTADGYIYLAIGNDVQWSRLTALDTFAKLASPARATNAGRAEDRATLHRDIGAITQTMTTDQLAQLLQSTGLVAAPIRTIPQVISEPPVRDVLLTTKTPDGRTVRLPPPSAETDHLKSSGREISYAPKYGEHTDDVLREVGLAKDEIAELRSSGIVA